MQEILDGETPLKEAKYLIPEKGIAAVKPVIDYLIQQGATVRSGFPREFDQGLSLQVILKQHRADCPDIAFRIAEYLEPQSHLLNAFMTGYFTAYRRVPNQENPAIQPQVPIALNPNSQHQLR